MAALVVLFLICLIGVTPIHGFIQLVNAVYPTNNVYATSVGLPNGVIYLMGGQNANGSQRTDDTWMYTPGIQAQPVLMSPMPRKLSQSCAVLVDDSLIFYVAGNTDTSNTGDILRYNTANDTWDRLVYFYNHRRAHACAYDSKRREILVFFGTSSSDGNIDPIRPERYHVDNNTVNSHPSWPGDFANHGAGSTAVYEEVTDKIYIMGGEANPRGLTILSQVTGWSNGSNLVMDAFWGSATIVNNEIWYFSLTALQKYNIANDTWRKEDVFFAPRTKSSSNIAPVSGPNIHLFNNLHTVLTCALPCPAPSSSCLRSTCDTLTGTCAVTPVNNGQACNVDGCTGPDCVCNDGACVLDRSSYDIQPFFECYRPSGSDGPFEAFLSWQNNEDSAVIITAGSAYNRFIGLNAELPPSDQPILFESGRSGAYPFNEFVLTWTGESITWRLSNYELKIDTASPSLLCPRNLSVVVTNFGDLITEEDLPALTEAVASKYNFSEERLHFSIASNNKRSNNDQKLKMEIDGKPDPHPVRDANFSSSGKESDRSSEPTPQEILNGFIQDIANKTNTVTVNEKEVEFNQITGTPPNGSRPGEPVVNPAPQRVNTAPQKVNNPSTSVALEANQPFSSGSGCRNTTAWLMSLLFLICSLQMQ